MFNTSYKKNGIRANFGLMTGTYSQYNMANEQSLLKDIYQANVGVKISKTANLWIDSGIMPAHIGFESAIGKDCITLTRSIMAENSPYYKWYNFYGQFNLAKNIIFLTAFDFGIQHKTTNSNQYHPWFSPVIITQYKPTSKIQLGTRGEFYWDPNQVIIATNTTNGFQTFGCSVNFDYLVTDAMMFRVEARSLSSKDAIFGNNNNISNNNLALTTTLALSF